MASVIFAEQSLLFALSSTYNVYAWFAGTMLFELVEGETYTVIWDGTEYTYVAKTMSLGSLTGIGLGNEAIAGIGEDSGAPFLFAYMEENAQNAAFSTDTVETEHIVTIYQGVLNEDTTFKGCSIILYDRTGAAVTYENVETITTDTPDSGVQAVFTHGEVMQGVEVELALAEGDQTLSVPEGYLVKEAVIKKPETLLPENIRKDVNIGGVTGTLIGTGVEKTVDLNMADGDQVVEADEETLMSRVIISKPETLVPENIAKGVEIGGVTGSANITEFDITDENIKKFGYQLDDENKQIIICAVLNSEFYSTNKSYDVTIPDKIGGYDVVLRSNASNE